MPVSEQRPEKLTVEDMKDLRFLECVIKVGNCLHEHDHNIGPISHQQFLLYESWDEQGPTETYVGNDYPNDLGKTN